MKAEFITIPAGTFIYKATRSKSYSLEEAGRGDAIKLSGDSVAEKDWVGQYFSDDKKVCEGYLYDYLDDNGNGESYIIKFKAKNDIRVLLVSDERIADESIAQAEKARLIKDFMKTQGVEGDLPLMDLLGKNQIVYKGIRNSEGIYEMVFAPDVLEKLERVGVDSIYRFRGAFLQDVRAGDVAVDAASLDMNEGVLGNGRSQADSDSRPSLGDDGLPARSSSGEVGYHHQRTAPTNESKTSREIARENTLNSLMQSFSHENSNRVMWNDRYDTLLTSRSPKVIWTAIEENVNEFGGLESYKEITGVDPFELTDPVCGLSANNMFKLMTEKDSPIDPTAVQYLQNESFAEHLKTLDPKKNHVVMVEDGRLGHKFLIDLPASTNEFRKAHIIQSDLGGGALPPVTIESWVNRRGSDNIPIDDLVQLLSDDFAKMPSNAQANLLASVLEVDKDPRKVDVGKTHPDGKVRFVSHEYDFSQFQRNAQYVVGTGQDGDDGTVVLERRPSMDGLGSDIPSARRPTVGSGNGGGDAQAEPGAAQPLVPDHDAGGESTTTNGVKSSGPQPESRPHLGDERPTVSQLPTINEAAGEPGATEAFTRWLEKNQLTTWDFENEFGHGFAIEPSNDEDNQIAKSIYINRDDDLAVIRKRAENFIQANFQNWDALPVVLYVTKDEASLLLSNDTYLPLARYRAEGWQAIPELPSADDLGKQAAVPGKVRGNSYQQILVELSNYHKLCESYLKNDPIVLEQVNRLLGMTEGYLQGHPDSARQVPLRQFLELTRQRRDAVWGESSPWAESFSRLYQQLTTSGRDVHKPLYLGDDASLLGSVPASDSESRARQAEAALAEVKRRVVNEYGDEVATAIFAELADKKLARKGQGIDRDGIEQVHRAIERHFSADSATLFVWLPSEHSRLGHAALQIGTGRTVLDPADVPNFQQRNYVSWWPLGQKNSDPRYIFNVATADNPELSLRVDLSQPASMGHSLADDVASEESDRFGLAYGDKDGPIRDAELKNIIDQIRPIDESTRSNLVKISANQALNLLIVPSLLETINIPEHVYRPFVEQFQDPNIDMHEVGRNFADALQKYAADSDPEKVLTTLAEDAEIKTSTFKQQKPYDGRVIRINLQGLDVAAMQREWRAISLNPDPRYQLMTDNCSSIVGRVLQAGGIEQILGKKWSPSLGIWTPTSLYKLGREIQRATADKQQNSSSDVERPLTSHLAADSESGGNGEVADTAKPSKTEGNTELSSSAEKSAEHPLNAAAGDERSIWRVADPTELTTRALGTKDTSFNYSKQLIVQIEAGDTVFDAAQALFGKHPKQSEWAQLKDGQLQNLLGWDAATNQVRRLDAPLSLDRAGQVRLVLVGRGSVDQAGVTHFGGKTAAQWQSALQSIVDKLPADKIRGLKLDLVGCELANGNLRDSLPGQLASWLAEQAKQRDWREGVSVSARKDLVSVDEHGKKWIYDPSLGWINKEEAGQHHLAHKLEWSWDAATQELVEPSELDHRRYVEAQHQPQQQPEPRPHLGEDGLPARRSAVEAGNGGGDAIFSGDGAVSQDTQIKGLLGDFTAARSRPGSSNIRQFAANPTEFAKTNTISGEAMTKFGRLPEYGYAKLVAVAPNLYEIEYTNRNGNVASHDSVPAYFLGYNGPHPANASPAYVDIPKQVASGTFLFTGTLSGCSVVVTELDANTYRVYHDGRVNSSVLYDNVVMAVDFEDYRVPGTGIGLAAAYMQHVDGQWQLVVQRQLLSTKGSHVFPILRTNAEPLSVQTANTELSARKQADMAEVRRQYQQRLRETATKFGVSAVGIADGVFEGGDLSLNHPAIAGWKRLREDIRAKVDAEIAPLLARKDDLYAARRSSANPKLIDEQLKQINLILEYYDAQYRTLLKESVSTDWLWLWQQKKAKDGTAAVVRIDDASIQAGMSGHGRNVAEDYALAERYQYGRQDPAFTEGHRHFRETEVPGLRENMTALEMKRLFLDGQLTPQQRGALAGHITQASQTEYIAKVLNRTAVFTEDFRKAGSTFNRLAPQDFYLSLVGDKFGGRCYPLVRAMAVAVANGGEASVNHLADKLFLAAADPQTGSATLLQNSLANLHSNDDAVMASTELGKVTLSDVVSRLGSEQKTSMFALNTAGHAMMVGVSVTEQGRRYSFYDPNVGFFAFGNTDSLSRAMNQHLVTHELAGYYGAFGSASEPQFNLIKIDTARMADVPLGNGLSVAHLTEPTELASVIERRRQVESEIEHRRIVEAQYQPEQHPESRPHLGNEPAAAENDARLRAAAQQPDTKQAVIYAPFVAKDMLIQSLGINFVRERIGKPLLPLIVQNDQDMAQLLQLKGQEERRLRDIVTGWNEHIENLSQKFNLPLDEIREVIGPDYYDQKIKDVATIARKADVLQQMEIRSNAGGAELGRLRPEHNKMYIIGHGAPGVDVLAADQAGTQGKVTAADVAQQLANGGLPRDFRDIRVTACYSADTREPTSFDLPDLQRAAQAELGPTGVSRQPFAQSLSNELFKAGYVAAEVTGYHGAGVVFGEWDYRVRVLIDELDNRLSPDFRASTVKQVFLPAGDGQSNPSQGGGDQSEKWRVADATELTTRALGAEDTSFNYNKQLIVQSEGEGTVFDAAQALFGKHPKQSEWVQLKDGQLQNLLGWDAATNQVRRLGAPLSLDRAGQVRLVLVGRGSVDQAGVTHFGGKTAAQWQSALQSIVDKLPADKIRGLKLDLVGCELASGNLRDSLPGQLASWLEEQAKQRGWREGVSISARKDLVSVDERGKKSVYNPSLGWVNKEEASQLNFSHKVEWTWDATNQKLLEPSATSPQQAQQGAASTRDRDRTVSMENDGSPPREGTSRKLIDRFFHDSLFGRPEARRTVGDLTQDQMRYAEETGGSRRVTLRGEAGRLTGYYHSADGTPSDKKVVLFLHGSGAPAEDQASDMAAYYRQQGADMLAVNFRGYGNSDGAPNEAGLYSDARTMFRYLVDELGISPSKIIIHGYSMGALVAADLARHVALQGEAVAGLLLDRPMPSMTKAIQAHGLPNPGGVLGEVSKRANGRFSVEKNLAGLPKETRIMLLTDSEGLGVEGEKLRNRLIAQGYQIGGEPTIHAHGNSAKLMRDYADSIVSQLFESAQRPTAGLGSDSGGDAQAAPRAAQPIVPDHDATGESSGTQSVEQSGRRPESRPHLGDDDLPARPPAVDAENGRDTATGPQPPVAPDADRSPGKAASGRNALERLAIAQHEVERVSISDIDSGKAYLSAGSVPALADGPGAKPTMSLSPPRIRPSRYKRVVASRDAISGLFGIGMDLHSLVETLRDHNPKNQGAGVLNRVAQTPGEVAGRVQVITQLVQSPISLVDNGKQLYDAIRSLRGLVTKSSVVFGKVIPVVSLALDAVNIGAISAELHHETNPERRKVVAANLGVAVIGAGLALTGIVVGALGLAAATGPIGWIGLPVAIAGMAVTYVVQVFAEQAEDFNKVKATFEKLMNDVSQPGFKKQDGVWQIGSAVVRELNFQTGQMRYGRVRVTPTEVTGLSTTAGHDHVKSLRMVRGDEAALLDVYKAYGIEEDKEYAIGIKDTDAAVLLPGNPDIDLMPTLDVVAEKRQDVEAYRKLRDMYGERFVWMSYDYEADNKGDSTLWLDNSFTSLTSRRHETNVVVTLDDKARTLIVPTLEGGQLGRLKYTLQGNGGVYSLVLSPTRAPITIRASAQQNELWVVDISQASHTYFSSIDVKDVGEVGKAGAFTAAEANVEFNKLMDEYKKDMAKLVSSLSSTRAYPDYAEFLGFDISAAGILDLDSLLRRIILGNLAVRREKHRPDQEAIWDKWDPEGASAERQRLEIYRLRKDQVYLAPDRNVFKNLIIARNEISFGLHTWRQTLNFDGSHTPRVMLTDTIADGIRLQLTIDFERDTHVAAIYIDESSPFDPYSYFSGGMRNLLDYFKESGLDQHLQHANPEIVVRGKWSGALDLKNGIGVLVNPQTAHHGPQTLLMSGYGSRLTDQIRFPGKVEAVTRVDDGFRISGSTLLWGDGYQFEASFVVSVSNSSKIRSGEQVNTLGVALREFRINGYSPWIDDVSSKLRRFPSARTLADSLDASSFAASISDGTLVQGVNGAGQTLQFQVVGKAVQLRHAKWQRDGADFLYSQGELDKAPWYLVEGGSAQDLELQDSDLQGLPCRSTESPAVLLKLTAATRKVTIGQSWQQLGPVSILQADGLGFQLHLAGQAGVVSWARDGNDVLLSHEGRLVVKLLDILAPAQQAALVATQLQIDAATVLLQDLLALPQQTHHRLHDVSANVPDLVQQRAAFTPLVSTWSLPEDWQNIVLPAVPTDGVKRSLFEGVTLHLSSGQVPMVVLGDSVVMTADWLTQLHSALKSRFAEWKLAVDAVMVQGAGKVGVIDLSREQSLISDTASNHVWVNGQEVTGETALTLVGHAQQGFAYRGTPALGEFIASGRNNQGWQLQQLNLGANHTAFYALLRELRQSDHAQVVTHWLQRVGLSGEFVAGGMIEGVNAQGQHLRLRVGERVALESAEWQRAGVTHRYQKQPDGSWQYLLEGGETRRVTLHARDLPLPLRGEESCTSLLTLSATTRELVLDGDLALDTLSIWQPAGAGLTVHCTGAQADWQWRQEGYDIVLSRAGQAPVRWLNIRSPRQSSQWAQAQLQFGGQRVSLAQFIGAASGETEQPTSTSPLLAAVQTVDGGDRVRVTLRASEVALPSGEGPRPVQLSTTAATRQLVIAADWPDHAPVYIAPIAGQRLTVQWQGKWDDMHWDRDGDDLVLWMGDQEKIRWLNLLADDQRAVLQHAQLQVGDALLALTDFPPSIQIADGVLLGRSGEPARATVWLTQADLDSARDELQRYVATPAARAWLKTNQLQIAGDWQGEFDLDSGKGLLAKVQAGVSTLQDWHADANSRNRVSLAGEVGVVAAATGLRYIGYYEQGDVRVDFSAKAIRDGRVWLNALAIEAPDHRSAALRSRSTLQAWLDLHHRQLSLTEGTLVGWEDDVGNVSAWQVADQRLLWQYPVSVAAQLTLSTTDLPAWLTHVPWVGLTLDAQTRELAIPADWPALVDIRVAAGQQLTVQWQGESSNLSWDRRGDDLLLMQDGREKVRWSQLLAAEHSAELQHAKLQWGDTLQTLAERELTRQIAEGITLTRRIQPDAQQPVTVTLNATDPVATAAALAQIQAHFAGLTPSEQPPAAIRITGTWQGQLDLTSGVAALWQERAGVGTMLNWREGGHTSVALAGLTRHVDAQGSVSYRGSVAQGGGRIDFIANDYQAGQFLVSELRVTTETPFAESEHHLVTRDSLQAWLSSQGIALDLANSARVQWTAGSTQAEFTIANSRLRLTQWQFGEELPAAYQRILDTRNDWRYSVPEMADGSVTLRARDLPWPIRLSLGVSGTLEWDLAPQTREVVVADDWRIPLRLKSVSGQPLTVVWQGKQDGLRWARQGNDLVLYGQNGRAAVTWTNVLTDGFRKTLAQTQLQLGDIQQSVLQFAQDYRERVQLADGVQLISRIPLPDQTIYRTIQLDKPKTTTAEATAALMTVKQHFEAVDLPPTDTMNIDGAWRGKLNVSDYRAALVRSEAGHSTILDWRNGHFRSRGLSAGEVAVVDRGADGFAYEGHMSGHEFKRDVGDFLESWSPNLRFTASALAEDAILVDTLEIDTPLHAGNLHTACKSV
ncbi:cycle-inhibiting factor, partial [Burkholderia ubonensis]|uniref:cycle-inhibiting factor n=1 Tax=Burkholderia ubonensis TaxID=101571 RepID=UPI0012FB8FA9